MTPKGGEIHGIEVHRSIKELLKGIDLAIIILPAKGNVLALKDCVDQGIEYFVLAADGFSEVDEKGKTIQEEIIGFITETGIRVIGLWFDYQIYFEIY